MESFGLRHEGAFPDNSAFTQSVIDDLRRSARTSAAEAAFLALAAAEGSKDLPTSTAPRVDGSEDACVPVQADEGDKPSERKEELPVAMGSEQCGKDSTDEIVRGDRVPRHVWHPSLKCPVCIHVRKLCQQAADILGRAHDQQREYRSDEEYVRRRDFQC